MTVFNVIGSVRTSQTSDMYYNGDGADNYYDKQGNTHTWHMDGGFGNDTLIGGQSNDILDGSYNNDELRGNAGRDTLFGGDGDDQLHGGEDNDNLIGGLGNDTLWGGSGHDDFMFYDESDLDIVHFHTGHDTIADFNPDNDEIFLDGDCLVNGYDLVQDGLDAVITHSVGSIRVSNTTVAELDGRIKDGDGVVLTLEDQVILRPFYDGEYNLAGNFGDDIFIASRPIDNDHHHLDGRWGHDTVSFAELDYGSSVGYSHVPIGVTVDLAAASVTWAHLGEYYQKNDSLGGTYSSIEGVIGSAFGDIIRGDSKHNSLVGNDGNDTIHGQDGDDTISGDEDDDKLYGGSGNDTVNGGTGADRIWGDDGNDALRGGDHNDIITGGNGNDTIEGGNGNDSLTGDNGDDTIEGGNGDDSLTGGSGNDTIAGGYGDDSLTGGAEADNFVTGHGADVIADFQWGIDRLSFEAVASVLRPMGMDTVIGFADGSQTTLRNVDLHRLGSLFDGIGIVGGDGAELLTGTAGSDTLTGGGSGDCFWASAGNDVITDFTSGSDRIDFYDFAGLTAADVAMRYYAVTDSLTLSWQDHSITLEGVSELAAGDTSLGVALTGGWHPDLHVATAAGFSGYAGQDRASAVTEVFDAGAGLKLSGNAWKAALLDGDYRLTAESRLEFDFKGNGLSEVWGIGVDNNASYHTGDPDPMATSGVVWLGGSQAADANVRHDGIFYGGNGAWERNLEIWLGEDLAGETIDRFVFVNDNDANAAAGSAEFADVWLSNVERVDSLDFAAAAPSLAGYASQNEDSGFAASADGTEAHVTGNSWMSVDLAQDYAITADTLLRFDVKCEGSSEAMRIGVDNDGLMNSQGNPMPAENLFSFGGREDVGLPSNGNVIRDPANFYDKIAGGWQSFEIELGDLLAGQTVDRFVMVNDNDYNSSAGGYFLRNVELVEADIADINVGLLFA